MVAEFEQLNYYLADQKRECAPKGTKFTKSSLSFLCIFVAIPTDLRGRDGRAFADSYPLWAQV